MHQVIARHKGELIGINLSKPKDLNIVRLKDANSDYITLEQKDGSLWHYATRYVICALEGDYSIHVGAFKKEKFTLQVQVYHFLVYSGGGSVDVGISF